MKGTSWMRRQDVEDALLNRSVLSKGVTDIPFFARRNEEREKHMRRWQALTPLRDGPVATEKASEMEPAARTKAVKELALEFGADAVGIAQLRPDLVEMGVELDHQWVIAMIVHEDYEKVLGGADMVEAETFGVYARCAEIATDLAVHIREEMGYGALAHHNGGVEIQAVPAMLAAGLGELGKHGSLINPQFGAGFRPGFVTTNMALTADEPISIGVQDYCVKCKLCTNVCPGGAIPLGDNFVTTDGMRRWLTDIEKCYEFSRMRPAYCHLCIDVCPYVHKLNDNDQAKQTYKTYLGQIKEAGWGTPKTTNAVSDPDKAGSDRLLDTRS
ncbi:MAG: 4Fe-4S dicluster domain-containing protein [Rhodospirillales bacterium]|jgi:ferredoxin|nr:4Fe-4S dicluster domain-containing protein [Rhodospirillales bacterium]